MRIQAENTASVAAETVEAKAQLQVALARIKEMEAALRGLDDMIVDDDLSQELRAFEGSDALGAGDFSVCIRGADCIKTQAARIAKLDGLAYGLMLAMSASGHDFTDILREARATLAGGKE